MTSSGHPSRFQGCSQMGPKTVRQGGRGVCRLNVLCEKKDSAARPTASPDKNQRPFLKIRVGSAEQAFGLRPELRHAQGAAARSSRAKTRKNRIPVNRKRDETSARDENRRRPSAFRTRKLTAESRGSDFLGGSEKKSPAGSAKRKTGTPTGRAWGCTWSACQTTRT